MKQSGHDIIKLLLFLFTIFLYLFIICYNEAFFRIFSFPYERITLPINFYLLNILRILFWNFSAFFFGSLMIVAIAILIVVIINFIIAILRGFRKTFTKELQSVSFYESNKFIINIFSVLITCAIMILTYVDKDTIFEYIIDLDYVLQWNEEFPFYVLISFYIFIFFNFILKKINA